MGLPVGTETLLTDCAASGGPRKDPWEGREGGEGRRGD